MVNTNNSIVNNALLGILIAWGVIVGLQTFYWHPLDTILREHARWAYAVIGLAALTRLYLWTKRPGKPWR